MSLTMFCLTSGCDFQFVQLPSTAAINECPQCRGRAFASEKGAFGQHPYHTDDAACLVCTLDVEIVRLRAEVERWASQQVYRAMALEITTLKHERDEALAQVAVLLQFVEDHATHLHEIDNDPKCPLCSVTKNLPAEARALLDRLDILK